MFSFNKRKKDTKNSDQLLFPIDRMSFLKKMKKSHILILKVKIHIAIILSSQTQMVWLKEAGSTH